MFISQPDLHALNNDTYPINERPDALDHDAPFYDMSRVAGKVSEGCVNKIEIKGVPIVVPAGGAGADRGGEELINSLDLVIEVRRPSFSSHRDVRGLTGLRLTGG